MLALYLLLPLRVSGGEDRGRAEVSRLLAFAVSAALAVFGSLLLGALVYLASFVGFWLAGALAPDPRVQFRALLWRHFAPFAAIAGSYCVFLVSVSPLYLYHAASRSYEAYLSSSSFAIRNYVAARDFSFSPFSHAYWGMLQDPPGGLTSLVVALFSLLEVLPFWEVSSFYQLVSLIFFANYVFSGYFLFLLLRELDVRWPIALATALALFIGNQFYANMVSQDMGWAGCYLVSLTASLWLLAVALRRDSFAVGAWSGLALASQFYIVAPHPEMTIYSVLIYIIVALPCLLIAPASTRLRGFLICVVSGLVFTLFSLAYLVPVVSHVFMGNTVVHGEDTIVPRTFVFKIPGMTFYIVALVASAALELLRWRKFGAPRPVLVGCLMIAGSILSLSIPGMPTAMHDVMEIVGWTVHLQPFDRMLNYMGFATLIVMALGLDAAIKLIPPSQIERFVVDLEKKVRPFAGRSKLNLGELGAIILLVVIGPLAVGSKPSVAIIDGSLWGIRESIEAVLTNSMTKADQRRSVPFLRERLLEFEARSTSWNLQHLPEVRKEYNAAIAKYGVATVRDLPSERVREFSYSVAPRIDEAYASVEWLDGIPDNVDRHFSGLDHPYVRVMAALGGNDFERQKREQSILGAMRNVVGAHNNSQMMDTRAYVAYPSLQALYFYPRSFLPSYREVIQQGDYFINGERPPWHYETEDVLNREFRKLLGIAGVGAYAMLPEKAVSEALQRPSENLEDLSRRGDNPVLKLVRDRAAYDTAYLARVVALVESKDIDRLAAESKNFFGQRIGLDKFREVLDPAAESLLAMPRRHDAVLEKPRDRPLPVVVTGATSTTEGPEARGGKVEIVNAIGPRIGLQVHCPDPHCVVVYNLAALPGWRAYVDKASQPILRANYGFIAVIVTRGDHFVSLVYETVGQGAAEWVSLLALLGMLGWARRREDGTVH